MRVIFMDLHENVFIRHHDRCWTDARKASALSEHRVQQHLGIRADLAISGEQNIVVRGKGHEEKPHKRTDGGVPVRVGARVGFNGAR